MGITSQRPPLPAPTESSVASNGIEDNNSDIGTDLSQHTARTHYSIPEDGREIHVPTKKVKVPRASASNRNSQTSLLIEYYDAGKSHDSSGGRPSVRVKVTPGVRKGAQPEKLHTAEAGTDRKPAYARRISFGSKNDSRGPPVSYSQLGEESNNSDRSPVEVEIMGHQSELSELPPESNVSSMPGDSLLEGPAKIKEPVRQRSRSLERAEKHVQAEVDTAKLKAPDVGRSRSLSKERITRKALEKIAREQSPEPEKPRRLQKSRPQSSGSELVEESLKPRSRRSSKSHRDSSDLRSATESSLLPPRDNESNLSGTSKVSLNNPKLLATVEDAIRRLILPEIETIKRNQSVRSTQTRDSYTTEGSMSRSGTNHRLSKSTSEPHVKSRHSDDGRVRDGDRRRRKHKKSSREVDSDATSSRRDSLDSVAAEKQRIRKSKESSRRRDSKGTDSSLTRANLKSHDSKSSVNALDTKHRDERDQGSRIKSQSSSIADKGEEYYKREEIPPMPMNSEIQDSEITRTSLLSADTVESEDNRSKSDHTAEQLPAKNTSREIPVATLSSSKSPRGSRSKDSLGLKTARSDRSISSKNKAAQLAAVGLGGAAGGLYGYKGTRNSSRSSSRKSSVEKRTTSGEQTVTNNGTRSKQDVATREAPVSEAEPPKAERPPTARDMSKDSIKTLSSTDYPVTSKRHIVDKRHETLNYEEPELLDHEAEQDPLEDQEDDEEFYKDQHELNDRYRSSLDEDTQRDSADWSKDSEQTPGASIRDSVDTGTFEQARLGRTIRGLGANPQVVTDTRQPESAVASLVNQSMVSEQSQSSAQEQHELHHKEDMDRLGESRQVQAQEQQRDSSAWLTEHANTSAERWNALRDHAEQMSSRANTMSSNGSQSPVKPHEQETKAKEDIILGASAIPGPSDNMPEVGYGHDAQSELTDHGSVKRPDSIVEGPLGDEYEARGLWPYEPTPDLERRGGFIHPDERDSRSIDSGVAAAMGAAAGAGLGIGAAETSKSAQESQPLPRQENPQATASDGAKYPIMQNSQPPQVLHHQSTDRQYLGSSPNNHKDEGYISAAHPRSPSAGSPLSFSKPPPRLFDERDVDKYDPAVPADASEDPFTNNKHRRQMSANSHGIPAEAYDAATGTGINNIQSKDVVALMDHLTVRDAHRNARDTEILVTLVRSAAEMRNNFDELKNYVDMQGQLNRRHTSSDANQVVNKILNGARAAALSSSGPSRTARFASPSSEKDAPPVKKKNIFRRAMSGLGSKNEKDISKIEDMLMQLLEDVESLKDAQASSMAGGSQRQIIPAKGSLDSYERLRAAPESGYEPDGQAGTSSTPGASGTFSPHSRQSAHRMHSGYNVPRDSTNRISTVMEHPEEHVKQDDYENDDGMLTPTQEAQQQRSGLTGNAYLTPPNSHTRGPSGGNMQLTPNTPRTNDTKGRQKSVSSSMYGGIPRVSRWSKTTTSSAPRDSYQRDRPYSEASRSGSDVNVLPQGDGETPYEPHDDDRLRSPNSMTRNEESFQSTGRSPSPLLPQDEAPIDDPKYRANRHSLTLEHPQPRQGSTHRHQSHLESQAYTYAGHRAESEKSSDRGSPSSPQADVFGSAPTLAKNRLSVRSGKSVSGDYGTPNSTGSGGYRPPKMQDDGPLVPQQNAPASRQVHESRRRDSLDSLSGDSYNDSLSQNSYRRPHETAHGDLDADAHSYGAEDYSTEGEGEGVPENTRSNEWEADSAKASEEGEAGYYPQPIPLDRPRSPYYPGAQLTTIEERYSLEQSRISSPLSRHQSVKSKQEGSSRIEEEVEDDSTPTQSPTKPLESPVTSGSHGARKVTPQGPRAMPGGKRVRS